MGVHQIQQVDRLSSAQALFARLSLADREMGGVAYLADDRRLLGLRIIGGGARDRVDILPRLVAIDALAFGARAVIVAHNHPSGNPRPSSHDLAHARRLARALDPIDVRLLDHLVVTHGRVTSLRAMGML